MGGLPVVECLGPVSAATALWRIGGVTHLVVVVKATFRLAAGEPMTLTAPLPVADHETAPYLTGTDVSFVGLAYPAEGCAPIRLALFADETQQRALLSKIVKVAAEPRDEGHAPATAACTAFEPRVRHSFGPAMAAAAQQQHVAPIEIDESYDWGLLRTVPPDQQCAFLTGAEWLLLEGLLPFASKLYAPLPAAVADVRVGVPPLLGGPSPLPLCLDTLTIDGNRGLCSLCWRGGFPLDEGTRPQDVSLWASIRLPGQVTTVWPPAKPLPASLAPERANRPSALVPAPTAPPAHERPYAPPVPTVPPAVRGGPSPAMRPSPWATPAPSTDPWDIREPAAPVAPVRGSMPAGEVEATMSICEQDLANARPALPFTPDAGTALHSAQPAELLASTTPRAEPAEATMSICEQDLRSALSPLPFGSAEARAPVAPSDEQARPGVTGTVVLAPEALDAAPGRPAVPFDSPKKQS